MVRKKPRGKAETEDSYQGESAAGESSSAVYFTCPVHGKIPREEVAFLCNKCGPQEMVYKGGMYLCPQCLQPGDNFQCLLCGSTKVEIKMRAPSSRKRKKS